MNIERQFVVRLLGISLAVGTASGSFQLVQAQGPLLQRLQERREAREQQDSSQQQNSAPQENAGQLPNQQPPVLNPDVSMVTLQTQPGANGQQMVITPKGMVVPLPGAGVAGPIVHVYMGSRGGFWYTDKFNQQVDLTPAVQMLQASQMQGQAAAAVPQYAPQPQMYGALPMGTAAVAGLGAMAGAAMGSAASGWGSVPYGTPVHYGAGAVPYYDQGGKQVYINASNNSATVNDVNSYHATAMQQQQAWYQQQQAAQGANWKNWQQPTANPFVNAQYQQGQVAQYGAAAGQAAMQYGAAQGAQAAQYGAAAGQAAAHYGAAQGAQYAQYGAAAGQAAAHYGAAQGAQDAQYGAAAGQAAQHYGAAQGEQDAKEGAAAGQAAQHYGAAQGEQDAKQGAAAGQAAQHYGASQGEQNAKAGAAAGKGMAAHGEQSEGGGRRGRFSGRSEGGADKGGAAGRAGGAGRGGEGRSEGRSRRGGGSEADDRRR